MRVSKQLACRILGAIASASLADAVVSHRGSHTTTCTLKSSGDDDGPAFAAALLSAKCLTVDIPAGTTLNIASPLNTTQTNNKHISLQGTISFKDDTSYWQQHAFGFTYQNASTFWLLGGENILLDGGGNGQAWYNGFSTDSTIVRPIPLTVYQAKNLAVRNIRVLQSPFWNFFVSNSDGIIFDSITLNSASTVSGITAKNTDGWDIYQSNNVSITNSNITNGDDCVSFKPNSTNIFVDHIVCDGSHGISVGSLGQYPGEFDIVENVTVSNIKMLNAQNGVRIKSWAGPNVGSGLVKNIYYSNWQESNVDNPIIIDSCYMTNASVCAQYPSKVPTENVFISNINGTSSGNKKSVVVNLNCSPGGTCTNININDITLSPPAQFMPATYTCANVKVSGDDASLFDCTAT